MQLVKPVNLTRKFFHELFNFQDWERAPKAKKLPFIEVISAIVCRYKIPDFLQSTFNTIKLYGR